MSQDNDTIEHSIKNIVKNINDNASALNEYLLDPTQQTAERLFGKENVLESKFTCKACHKLIPITQLQVFDTPVVKGCTAEICNECWQELKKAKAAIIVCMKCKELRHVLEPIRNARTGFELKPGNFYHIMDCPKCNPDKYLNNTVPAEIIEEALYNNRKFKLDGENTNE